MSVDLSESRVGLRRVDRYMNIADSSTARNASRIASNNHTNHTHESGRGNEKPSTPKKLRWSKTMTDEERLMYNKQRKEYRNKQRKNDPLYHEKERARRRSKKPEINAYNRKRFANNRTEYNERQRIRYHRRRISIVGESGRWIDQFSEEQKKRIRERNHDYYHKHKEEVNRRARERWKRKRKDELYELEKLTDQELLIRSSENLMKTIEREVFRMRPSILQSITVEGVLSLLHERHKNVVTHTCVDHSESGNNNDDNEYPSEESRSEEQSLATQPEQHDDLFLLVPKDQETGTITKEKPIIPETIEFVETTFVEGDDNTQSGTTKSAENDKSSSVATDCGKHALEQLLQRANLLLTETDSLQSLSSESQGSESQDDVECSVTLTEEKELAARVESTRKADQVELPNKVATRSSTKNVVTRPSSKKEQGHPPSKQIIGRRVPGLNSYLLDDHPSTETIMCLLEEFITNNMLPFEKFFHPIVPSTNNCRMNYQSRQAIRVFYGKNQSQESDGPNEITRYVYGPLAVLNSTGSNPCKHYKVYPFTEELNYLAKEFSQLMSRRGSPNKEFNFLEVKIYLGNDVFKKKNGEVLTVKKTPLRLGCNKVVNSHNDLQFSDHGVQSINDTARSDTPTITVTVGSSRTIVFEHLYKDKTKASTAWSTAGKEYDQPIQLKHGSIFVLSPEDDKPKTVDTRGSKIHKTKHRVEFKNEGVSFAFVFRCVRKTSKFDLSTDLWLWKFESKKTQESVKKYMRCLPSRNYINCYNDQIIVTSYIHANIYDYLKYNHGYKFHEQND
jgi:hypothetical protein